MQVNGIFVMRRKKDGYLNATQILKVAGIDKGKRTKILEKEIQTGPHEKIQGGYGKYQGTWIMYDRGVEVCRQYGVKDLLQGLLTYNMGQNMDPNINTPTKEQAMAAQRKRMYTAAAETRNQSQPGTFFRNISATASNALSAINKARLDSPSARGAAYARAAAATVAVNPGASNTLSRVPTFSCQSSGATADDTPITSQQSYISTAQPDFDSAVSQPSSQQQPQSQGCDVGMEPPRKRQRILTPAGSFMSTGGSYEASGPSFTDYPPGSPTEPNESFVYIQAGVAPQEPHQPSSQPYNGPHPLPPLPVDVSLASQHKRSMLMKLFMDFTNENTASDVAQYIQQLEKMSPQDLDMPVDQNSHTSLHWAATLSRTCLLRALVACGASPYRVNASGETPLMRAAMVTNSMEFSTFPDLLDMLGGTIDVADKKGRTVLHHIAVASAVKSRNAASKYYLESLLEWVVRQGSAANNASNSLSQPASSQQSSRPRMNLRRFMDYIVNAQDKSGDTALNIAARIGNRSIISQLIEVGADSTIANRAGLTPQDFGVGAENWDGDPSQSMVGGGSSSQAQQGGNSQKRESSGDISDCGFLPKLARKDLKFVISLYTYTVSIAIANILNQAGTDFQTELKTKQRTVDQLTAQIRTITAVVADSKRNLELRQSQLRAQQLARQRVVNYLHANEEEKLRLADLERQNLVHDASAVEKWDSSSCQQLLTYPPSASVLRSRLKGLGARTELMQRATAALQGRSRHVELKYRKLVSLCTGAPEEDVEGLIDSLLRAVESEKGELDLGRVRRFLGGVGDAVC